MQSVKEGEWQDGKLFFCGMRKVVLNVGPKPSAREVWQRALTTGWRKHVVKIRRFGCSNAKRSLAAEFDDGMAEKPDVNSRRCGCINAK
jgi:hypothetical protein